MEITEGVISTHSVLGVVFLVLTGIITKVLMAARIARLQANLVALQRRQRECQVALGEITEQLNSAQNTLSFHRRRKEDLEEDIEAKKKELEAFQKEMGVDAKGEKFLNHDLLKAVASTNPYWEVEHQSGTVFERSTPLAILPVADGHSENFLLADVLTAEMMKNHFFVMERTQITHEPKVKGRLKLTEILSREEYDKLKEIVEVPLIAVVRSRGNDMRVTFAECKILNVPRGLMFFRIAYQPPIHETEVRPQGLTQTVRAMVRALEVLVPQGGSPPPPP